MPKKNAEEPFSVSFNFGYGKKLCIRGVCHDILSETFCRTVPKKLVEEFYSVSLISVIEKLFAQEGYVMIFCRIFFVSQCQKNLYMKLLVFH